MSDIKTWHERAMRHPDHQSGMISECMIRARMAEEIADLRAEVDRLLDRLTQERDEKLAERIARELCNAVLAVDGRRMTGIADWDGLSHYSRMRFLADVEATLDAIKAAGFTVVEAEDGR